MVSVTRPITPSKDVQPDRQAFLSQLSAQYAPADLVRMDQALELLTPLFQGMCIAETGEALLPHTLGTAAITAQLKLDADAVVASLLFAWPDVDSNWRVACEARFGETVTKLIDGIGRVRKIQELQRLDSPALKADERHAQAEALRKMLLAMVEDIRAVLIKLAWRTQTMHYLSEVDADTARMVARETLDVFAPLANRLGVWQIKWELEDLAFRYLEPQLYKKIAKLLDEKRLDREQFIADVLATLRIELSKAEIQGEVTGRPKHIYSIYKKMQKKHLDFSEVYDVRAVRVLVEDIKDCYTVLGIVHNLWQPIPGEFDDYIAQPKGNFYRSLHTAVVGPNDKAVEVQIRTYDMHRHAELGVAAHWRYKEGGKQDPKYEEKIAWLRQILEWRDDVSDVSDLAHQFRTELFQDSVYVLTPQGKVVALPKGSTPVDFAYHVHTDLGHRCRGAKVDGKIVPLDTSLDNGQRIEILAAKQGGPSVDWLHRGFLKSPRAMQKVRAWIRAQHTDIAIHEGRLVFEREVARQGITQPKLEQIAEKLGYASVDEFYKALGHDEITLRQLAAALHQAESPVVAEPEPAQLVRQSRASRHSQGVLIVGVDKLMTQLSKCCKPVPPDDIVGFVTRGRGISIHRSQCLTLKRLSAHAPERLIEASWGHRQDTVFPVEIEVEAHDRQSLLRDISDAIMRDKVNITAANTLSKDHRAFMRFTVEIRDGEQLRRITTLIRDVPGVIEVTRR
ncbi:GTP pyrophosphokinase [Chitinivorax tropicus]|uniref:GTP pyrophosphokinase n=1 Tax=Chitinivorax tropicus TaxID=714531 RepID=A0A840MXX1_9PROT|nr:bifunctional (p)ppGpp synthetase/guanosine-3',5'-bis(diphosphate) 3'-pyrophosphohydrolase [Chitinivorax tropicus]MBB5020001.1 GTP pyrophosphokinase [Chitinivorax tropicus]